MPVELDSGLSASPEDLFGSKGATIRNISGRDVFVRVADKIEELKPLTESLGARLVEFYGCYIFERPGQMMSETELQFMVDEVDEKVWVSEQEVDKFKEIFGPLVQQKGSVR